MPAPPRKTRNTTGGNGNKAKQNTSAASLSRRVCVGCVLLRNLCFKCSLTSAATKCQLQVTLDTFASVTERRRFYHTHTHIHINIIHFHTQQQKRKKQKKAILTHNRSLGTRFLSCRIKREAKNKQIHHNIVAGRSMKKKKKRTLHCVPLTFTHTHMQPPFNLNHSLG